MILEILRRTFGILMFWWVTGGLYYVEGRGLGELMRDYRVNGVYGESIDPGDRGFIVALRAVTSGYGRTPFSPSCL